MILKWNCGLLLIPEESNLRPSSVWIRMELVRRMQEDGDGREWVLYGNIVVDAEVVVWELLRGDLLDVMVIVSVSSAFI